MALNRKYRPQSFDSDELVGQDHVVRTLKNAIRSNRVAQAYLFCGPRGTGKTSTARILAKAVNCLDPDPDKRPCNVCSACVAINSGATPDVIEIDAASNRGIDDIRDLRERVNYAPTQLRTKFYIIDEAHQITGPAANAFLKTLEEPPGHTKFVLATTDPEELLPTIVSRCQRFDFRRHTKEGIAKRVGLLAEREGVRLTPDAIDLVADLAHGSMRDPVGLLEQLANYHPAGAESPEIDADTVRDLVGITRSELALRAVRAIVERDPTAALAAVNEAVHAGQDVRQLNRQITGLIRDLLHVASNLPVHDNQDELRAIATVRPMPELVDIATAFLDTDSEIRSTVIPQLPLELAILKSTLAPVQASPPERLGAQPTYSPPPARQAAETRVETAPPPGTAAGAPPVDDNGARTSDKWKALAQNRTGGRAVQERAPSGEAETGPASMSDEPEAAPGAGGEVLNGEQLTLERLVDMWPNVRADVKSLDRRIEALMLEIDPVEISGNRITLVSQYEFHRNMLNDATRRSVIESVVTRRAGQPYRVEVVLRTEFEATVIQAGAPIVAAESPIESTEAGPFDAPDVTEDQGEKFLGAVIRMFDGEIVDETLDRD